MASDMASDMVVLAQVDLTPGQEDQAMRYLQDYPPSKNSLPPTHRIYMTFQFDFSGLTRITDCNQAYDFTPAAIEQLCVEVSAIFFIVVVLCSLFFMGGFWFPDGQFLKYHLNLT